MSASDIPEEDKMGVEDLAQQQEIIDGVNRLTPIDYAKDDAFPWIK